MLKALWLMIKGLLRNRINENTDLRIAGREQALVSGTVASISLGSTCQFILETWDKLERVVVDLKDGDIFIMGEECQKYYVHSIPYTQMENHRISLTFREFK